MTFSDWGELRNNPQPTRPRRAVGIIAVVILMIAAMTAGCDRKPGPSDPRAEQSFWDQFQKSAAADGTVSKELALQAFAYTFGDIPGVEIPPHSGRHSDDPVSGSGPVRWTLNHWQELTADQQHAVSGLLTASTGAAPALGADPSRVAALETLRDKVDRYVREIGHKLGKDIPRPDIRLAESEKPERDWAWAKLRADGETVDSDMVNTEAGPAVSCTLTFAPRVWRADPPPSDGFVNALVAHEVTHCFQAFGYPNLTAYRSAPRWIIEGGAHFAAADLTGRQEPWRLYLSDEESLFQRTYGAGGWWFQVQHLGHDPWQVFPTIWSGALDNFHAFKAAGGDTDAMYDSWAPSRLRMPEFGDRWDVHGSGVPGPGEDCGPPEKDANDNRPHPCLPQRILINAEDGSVDVGPFDTRIVNPKLTLPAGEGGSRIIRVTGSQPVHLHDGQGFEAMHFTVGDFCVGDSCVCPDDAERAGEQIQKVQEPLWLAVPGGNTGTLVKTDVISLADYCKHRPPDRPVVPDPPSEPSGLDGPSLPDNLNAPFEHAPAGSNGDPHLTSFDGHSFDFQAGGEFTLVRSDSGDLEVQARQEPLRRPDGHENTTISVNTAVAINAGTDRVGIYQHPDRPELRINGQVVAPREAQQLSGGVRIQPDQGGYQLVWPDSSTVWVLPTGSYGLNVMITAAPGRKASMHGLLGPFAGQPRNPAMEDRAGRHYDQVASAELYKSVGPSWRITQVDSLFDYAPGQSTQTFTRVDMPTQILTVDDLTPAQRDAGKRACAGIANPELARQCEFDVGLTADPEFAAGYQKVSATIDLGSTSTAIGQPIGPTPIEPGQKRTFTFEGGSPETDLYFGTDSDCGTSWAVFWRVTAPDGKDSLLTGMCNDIGRWHTNTPGTWRVDVSVPAGSSSGGTYAFRVLRAGSSRIFPITLPAEIGSERPSGAGILKGPGAEDRFQFDGLAGDKVSVTAAPTCKADDVVEWGLENPDGSRITLRTPACKDLSAETLTKDGHWAVVIFNRNADNVAFHYEFTIRRQ